MECRVRCGLECRMTKGMKGGMIRGRRGIDSLIIDTVYLVKSRKPSIVTAQHACRCGVVGVFCLYPAMMFDNRWEGSSM